MRGKSLLTAMLFIALILPVTIGSVYATHIDPNKKLKVEVEAKQEVNGDEYRLMLKAQGPDGNSLKGNGHYKFKHEGENTDVRNFQITGSQVQVQDNGYLIVIWALDGADLVVINITINNGDSVYVTTPIGSWTFTGESVKVDVQNP